MTTIERNFPSWYDFITCVNDESLFKWKPNHRDSHNPGTETGWSGTKSWDQAIDMALYSGWPEGRNLLINSLAIVSPKPEPYKSIAYDVAGAFPMVPLYLTGEPAHMMNFPEFESVASNPIVRIDYNISVSGSVSPKSIMLRGAAVLSLCNTLENKGYSCEIRIFDICSSGNDTFRYSIVFKRAGEPLDLDRAAFALAHPSTLRRFGFALQEQIPEHEKTMNTGYGHPIHQRYDSDLRSIFLHSTLFGYQETPESARKAVELAAEQYLNHEN
jgi:hypothetical protein